MGASGLKHASEKYAPDALCSDRACNQHLTPDRWRAAYAQNAKTPEDYYAALDDGRLPVMRGIALTPDDLVRRAVIQALIYRDEVSMESVGIAYLIHFKRYFSGELERLTAFARDGMVELDQEWITITLRGRLLVRAVCMIFNHYLKF